MAPSPGTQRLKDRELWKYFDRDKIVNAKNATPVSSYDPALKAFAQLGALRLSAKRCMISLFDKSNQYIVAEATQTLSLQDDSIFEEGDGVWLGASILPKCNGLCKLVVDGDSLPDLSELSMAGAPYVIPDLKIDERFRTADFGPSGCAPSRFYAGVPITTNDGAAIGSYCVLDDKPRSDLNPVLLRFMEHVAATVMSHLELTRKRDDEIRGNKMVQGLSGFIAGSTGRESAARSSFDRKKAVANQLESEETSGTKKDAEEDDGITDVQRICSRASNLIKESLEVDGVIFFDASVTALDHLSDGADASDTAESTNNISSGEELKHPPPTIDLKDDAKYSGILGYSVTSEDGSHEKPWTFGNITDLEKYMLQFLKRHTKGKVINLDEEGAMFSGGSSSDTTTSEQRQSVSKKVSRKSSKRVSERLVSQTIVETFPGARSVAMTPLWDSHRERWFAGVLVWSTKLHRSLDMDKDLSYLAAFGNSIMAEIAQMDANNANKAKSALLGSISHELRSPLHGIMGGLEILEDSALDAFQVDVLHTVETCGKTLLDTIDHLLDFSKINHSMQNEQYSRRSKYPNGSAARDRPREILEIVGNRPFVDLDVLVEEVIEVVFAGHAKRLVVPPHVKSVDQPVIDSALMQHHDKSSHANPNSYWKIQGSGIVVTLEIDHNVNWSVRTQPGAMRRIVMNLFSNALKYTEHGFIDISLKAEAQIGTGDEEQSKVVFTITDSGRGMSKKYLQDRLYKPFAQENVLDPGTGLGLSIVSQIVSSLGGKITLKSTQWIGTSICVSIPMVHGPIHEGTGDQNLIHELQRIRRRSKGMCVGIVTPGITESHDSPHQEIRSPSLETSITSILTEWFDMVVLPPYDSKPSIYLVIESASNFASLSGGEFLQNIPQQTSPENEKPAPFVIVLCRSSESAYHLASARKKSNKAGFGHIIEYITQPCAPRKLARALSLCFNRSAEWCAVSKEMPVANTRLDDNSTETPSKERSVSEEFVIHRRESLLSPEPFGSRSQKSSEPSSTISSDVVTPDLEQDTSIDRSLTTVSATRSSFLLTDDNPINLKILIAYMKKNNYPYTIAMNGQQALDTYRTSQEKPRIILMDISMPVMDGLASTRAIRAFEREQKLTAAHIIILTGLIEDNVQKEAIASGANLFLTKPVRLKVLGQVVEPLLEAP